MAAIAMALEQDLNRISSTSFDFLGGSTSTCDTSCYQSGPVRIVERVVVEKALAKPLFAVCQYCEQRNAPELWECRYCGGPFPFD